VCAFRSPMNYGFSIRTKFYDCHGEVWMNESGIILRISEAMDLSGPFYHFWGVMTYGWLEKDGTQVPCPGHHCDASRTKQDILVPWAVHGLRDVRRKIAFGAAVRGRTGAKIRAWRTVTFCANDIRVCCLQSQGAKRGNRDALGASHVRPVFGFSDTNANLVR
jgi:hypothetical protein